MDTDLRHGAPPSYHEAVHYSDTLLKTADILPQYQDLGQVEGTDLSMPPDPTSEAENQPYPIPTSEELPHSHTTSSELPFSPPSNAEQPFLSNSDAIPDPNMGHPGSVNICVSYSCS